MTEDELLGVLPLADRLRVAAVDLAQTGAPRALAVAYWRAADTMNQQQPGTGRPAPTAVTPRL